MTHLSIRGMNWTMDEMQYVRDCQHGETLTTKRQMEIRLEVAQGMTKQVGFPSIVERGEKIVCEIAQTLTTWNLVEAIESRINYHNSIVNPLPRIG